VASAKRISLLESLLLVILCGFALAFLFETTKLQQTAALFPRLVAEASLLVFVIAGALRLLKSSATAVEEADSMSGKTPKNALSFGAALALQAGYVAACFFLGFPIATLIYLLACPRLMGYQRWKILFPYAVLLTSAVFLAFAYVLHVRFPRGLLWG
jgi:tripartite tricarboxylate transporter TctB family protein